MGKVFLRFPFSCDYKSVDCEQNGIHCSHLHDIISTALGLSDFSLQCNGKKVPAEQNVLPNTTVHISFSLPGGKGGFGSMLRAIGAQIEKTTNREACRDLSGRRLRDINEEQRLKNWIAKKAEREAEKMRRRKERLERLKSQPKHNFVDFEYEKEISELPERIDDALSAGIEIAKKRPSEMQEPSSSGNIKKKRLWLDEDISETSDSDLSSNEENDDLHIETQDLLRSVNEECNNAECNEGASCQEDQVNSDAKGSQLHENQELTTTFNPNQENVTDRGLNSIECLIDEKEVHNSLKPEAKDDTPINLNDYKNAEELEVLGLERLKNALMLRGLKCGGTLADRARRLWAIRDLNSDQYPKNFLAKQRKE